MTRDFPTPLSMSLETYHKTRQPSRPGCCPCLLGGLLSAIFAAAALSASVRILTVCAVLSAINDAALVVFPANRNGRGSALLRRPAGFLCASSCFFARL